VPGAGVKLVRNVDKRRNDQTAQRQVPLPIRLAGAEANNLGRRLGHIERAEHPVPQRQVDPEIPVEVPRRITVVNLVLRRAVDDVFGNRAE